VARTSKNEAGVGVLSADECATFRASYTDYRTFLSLILLLSVFAILLTSPATAQESVFSTRGTPPRYEVFSDGTFIIGGDVIGNCKSLLQEV
jgi:hypothetical protein